MPNNPKCKAVIKRTGQRCKSYAMNGQEVCQYHGGRAPQNRRKGAERVALAEAKAQAIKEAERATSEAEKFGLPVTSRVSAIDALEETLDTAYRMQARFSRLVTELNDMDLRYTSTQKMEQLRAEVDAWLRTAKLVESLAAACLKNDLDQARIHIDQVMAAAVVSVIQASLARLGVDASGQDVSAIVANELENLASHAPGQDRLARS